MILRAADEDLSTLVRLEAELFGTDAWSEASLLAELHAPVRLVLVATSEVGAVVGYAVTLVAGDVADLLRIGVDPAHQRHGLASDLLDKSRSEAASEGATRMLLEVNAANAPAIEFYRAHQFVTLDRRPAYYRDGTDALIMQRLLPDPS